MQPTMIPTEPPLPPVWFEEGAMVKAGTDSTVTPSEVVSSAVLLLASWVSTATAAAGSTPTTTASDAPETDLMYRLETAVPASVARLPRKVD
eukprot:4335677-Prymnesium_polylepis.1